MASSSSNSTSTITSTPTITTSSRFLGPSTNLDSAYWTSTITWSSGVTPTCTNEPRGLGPPPFGPGVDVLPFNIQSLLALQQCCKGAPILLTGDTCGAGCRAIAQSASDAEHCLDLYVKNNNLTNSSMGFVHNKQELSSATSTRSTLTAVLVSGLAIAGLLAGL